MNKPLDKILRVFFFGFFVQKISCEVLCYVVSVVWMWYECVMSESACVGIHEQSESVQAALLVVGICITTGDTKPCTVSTSPCVCTCMLCTLD